MSALDLRIPPSDREAPRSRRALSAWLDREGLASPKKDDVVLAAWELIANGIAHGGDNIIQLRARRTDRDVEVEVVTIGRASPSGPSLLESRQPLESGRGLEIVAALADHLTIVADSTGFDVTCRFDTADRQP